MSNQIGTCSICGGAVKMPEHSSSAVPPKPTCTACGAVAAAPQQPVIQMQPRMTTDARPGTLIKVRDV